MRISTVLTCLLLLFCSTGFTQDKVYFTSNDKDAKTESITASAITYTTTGKKASSVTTDTKKLQLLFNKNGDFLAFERLDFSNARTQEAIRQFLNGPGTVREKDQVYSLTKGRIDDKVVTEDKNFIYLQTNAEKIEKKSLAAVVYKDGHHVLYAPAEKAAIVLWDNKPTPAGTEATTTKKEQPPVSPNTSAKPVEAKPVEVKKDPVTAPVTNTPPATTTKPAPPPVQTPPPSVPAQSPEHPLKFEEVAGNISKAEFEKKALQKTNQLNIYLKVICDKSANYEEINKAIDQSMSLFVDENAMIETSSINRNDVKRYKIRSYLSHIKLVNYDKIEIEWTNVEYVSDVKQGPDGNYYGVVSFEQVFRGYRDGKLIYQDVTRKNATVVLKTYEKNIDGNTKNVWDVLLSDIGVISTKSL